MHVPPFHQFWCVTKTNRETGRLVHADWCMPNRFLANHRTRNAAKIFSTHKHTYSNEAHGILVVATFTQPYSNFIFGIKTQPYFLISSVMQSNEIIWRNISNFKWICSSTRYHLPRNVVVRNKPAQEITFVPVLLRTRSVSVLLLSSFFGSSMVHFSRNHSI